MVKDLETSCLDGKRLSQVSNVYDRPVSFPFPPGSGVLVLNHDRPASASRQEGYSKGQDWKCVRQVVETHDRTVTRGLSQGLNTQSGRVGEISNMPDILPIHHDKLEKYNQLCKDCSRPWKNP